MTAIQPCARINLRTLLIGALLLALGGLPGCGPGASEQRRNDYLAAHPETNGTTSSLIQSGRVAPGMTKGEVIAAWGAPPSDCKSFQTNLMTIWDYCHHPGRTLVIFDQNGRVSNVQMP
ncbi:MAG: hypothetical protein ACLQU2_11175 [Candidatus Binataceae bacterium]